MPYYINYRQGELGNTVLAHILYSCNQISIDLDCFFSESGNSHYIYEINSTELKAAHLEYRSDKSNCVLELRSRNFLTRLMRYKMAYEKFYQQVPTLLTYQKFFSYNPEFFNDWEEFYNQIKDPSWPSCSSFNDVNKLPAFIQEEISTHYYNNSVTVDSDQKLLEFLSVTYYDILKIPDSKQIIDNIYFIEDYLAGEFFPLREVAQKLKWQWDNVRSTCFFQKVLQVNQSYFDWANKIDQASQKLLSKLPVTEVFDVWEQSLIIVKTCMELKIDPRHLPWNQIDSLNAVKF